MRKSLLRLVAVSLAAGSLAACQFGPGPIEQSAIDNMNICNQTHDATACAQWTYQAPLVQGERDRIKAENDQKTAGALAGAVGALGIAAAFSH